MFSEVEKIKRTSYESEIAKAVRVLIGKYFEPIHALKRMVFFKAKDGTLLAIQPDQKTQVNVYAYQSLLAEKFNLELSAELRSFYSLKTFFDVQKEVPCIAIKDFNSKRSRVSGGEFTTLGAFESILDQLFSKELSPTVILKEEYNDDAAENLEEKKNRKAHLRVQPKIKLSDFSGL